VKERLVADLKEAHRVVVSIGDREVEALIAGDLPAVVELGAPLQEAREKRDAATIALRRHVVEHGC
jgi:soluble P-type ATPase